MAVRRHDIAGILLRLLRLPREAPDEVLLYLPGNRVLISPEVNQGATLPSILNLRAVLPRPGAVGLQPE